MGWKRQPEMSGLWLSCDLPIDHACCFPCTGVSPDASSKLSPPNVIDKARGTFLYDFLYNLNYAPVWDEHFPLSLEGEEKKVLFNALKKFMAGN